MYIVIICSLICLILAYLDSIGKTNGAMKWGFILVTFLGAIHYDYGNDYMSYYQGYLEIEHSPFNFNAIMDGEYHRDPGWALLLMLSRYIGVFFPLVAILNIIQNWIIYKSIVKYVDKKWWTFSVFIYLFTTSLYLLEFSMMRQFFVMAIFLAMWPYIISRKWYIPMIVLYLCSYVHASSIILLPFAFWGFLPIRQNKAIGVMYVAVFTFLWLMGNAVGNAIDYIISINDTMDFYYSRYEDGTENLTFGLGFVMNLIPIFLSMYYLFKHDNTDSNEKISLVVLTSLGYLLTPFAWIIHLAGRMSMYFCIYNILTIPYIYSNIKNKNMRIALIAVLIIVTLYSYYIFFGSETWSEKYTEYHTIFNQLQ